MRIPFVSKEKYDEMEAAYRKAIVEADTFRAFYEKAEQGRLNAIKKLKAANKENKHLLAVNTRLAEHLGRSPYKSNLNQEEDAQ